jgi:protein-tyrosine phosphatase
VSTAEHRAEFLAAVKKLIGQMATQTPTCIFCHRGLGRSPLVVAAAFQYFYHESVTDAINRTLQIQQKAQFSYLSLSALHWCRIHLNHLS